MLCTRKRTECDSPNESEAGMAPRKDDLFWNAIMNVKIKKSLNIFRRRPKLERAFVNELAHRFQISEVDVKKVHAIFVAMDEDGSGSISSNEVATMLMGFGCDVSPKVVQAVMRTSDVNGDGEINFEEFLCAVTSKIKQDGATSEGNKKEIQVLSDTEDQKNLPVCPWEEEQIHAEDPEKHECVDELTCQQHRPCKELAAKYEDKMREEYRQAINSVPTSPEFERKENRGDDELNNNREKEDERKKSESNEDVWQQNEELDHTIRSATIYTSMQMLDFSDFVQVVQTV
ncbi:unnamed protein product, partial [Mesorhabditis belari]|uniref:EF-hand domain-containing protein n=1 Tax=Mesorhabditis belari TaxID=2138241 RepID=A0AAF3EA06_9BILA